MNQKFCKFFKNGLVYNNNSVKFTVSPCCYYNKTNALNPNHDLNIQLKKNRDSWLSDDIAINCKICIDHENSGLFSYRQAANNLIPDATDEIVFLTVAVNKKCNLACPMCDSGSSSYWYQENLRNNIPQRQDIIQLHADDKEGIITDRFIELLTNIDLSHLRYIKFGGGEPLMNDTHLKILKLIPHPENVEVQYTSNFSIMPTEDVFSVWENFKLIKWAASLDGVDEYFEFLRWPYKWEKFLNFKEKAFATVPVNVMFVVEHTLTPLNIFYFDKFEEWFNKNFSENRLGDKTDFNMHIASGILGLEKTPTNLRKEIYNKYGNDHKISSLVRQTPIASSSIMVNYLDNLDSFRNTKWREVFWEIEKFYV
jgi:hypothetical protein